MYICRDQARGPWHWRWLGIEDDSVIEIGKLGIESVLGVRLQLGIFARWRVRVALCEFAAYSWKNMARDRTSRPISLASRVPNDQRQPVTSSYVTPMLWRVRTPYKHARVMTPYARHMYTCYALNSWQNTPIYSNFRVSRLRTRGDLKYTTVDGVNYTTFAFRLSKGNLQAKLRFVSSGSGRCFFEWCRILKWYSYSINYKI